MSGSRKQQQSAALKRQFAVAWQLVLHPNGMTYAQLRDATGVAKSTFHRYLEGFAASDLMIDRYRVGGETRYCLLAARQASLAITDLQLHALSVARSKLGALHGAQITKALDELIKLAKRGRASLPKSTIRVRVARAVAPEHLAAIDQALAQGKRMIVRYRGHAVRAPQARRIDPVASETLRSRPH